MYFLRSDRVLTVKLQLHISPECQLQILLETAPMSSKKKDTKPALSQVPSRWTCDDESLNEVKLALQQYFPVNKPSK